MAMTVQKTRRMVVIELSAAEKHFLDKYVNDGQLPVFKKLLEAGTLIKTRVGSTTAPLTPWTIWPSIYTGIKPDEHGIIGFGQTPQAVAEQCIWNVLNTQQITTGLFGCLMRVPVLQNPYSLFYVPGILGASESSYPDSLNAIQKFFVFIKKNNVKRSFGLAIKLLFQLLFSAIKGMPFLIVKVIILQMCVELLKGISYYWDRALLRAKCQMDIFLALYRQYKPQFSTIHLEHIASAENLYWRAAEPETFSDESGGLDNYYFENVEARKVHELLFKDAILDSFKLADGFLAQLLSELDDQTVLVIITGLGQKKRDPYHQIHKPEIRFYNVEKLLKAIDVTNCDILMQANPNITLNFKDVSEASLGAFNLSNLSVLGEYALFKIEQRGNQLFLEENLSPAMWVLGEDIWVENKSNERIFPLFDYVKISQLRDQHTADYSSEGWILFYGNTAGWITDRERVEVTEIFPLLLSYFGDKV